MGSCGGAIDDKFDTFRAMSFEDLHSEGAGAQNMVEKRPMLMRTAKVNGPILSGTPGGRVHGSSVYDGGCGIGLLIRS